VNDNAVNVNLKYAVKRHTKLNNLDIEVIAAGSSEEGISFFLFCTRRNFTLECAASTPSYILCYTADATDHAESLVFETGCNGIMHKPQHNAQTSEKGFLENPVKGIKLQGRSKLVEIRVRVTDPRKDIHVTFQ
jgi:hypothetical protein